MKLGIGLLLTVIGLWVGSGNLIQRIFESVQFGKPFFLTYFSTGMFGLYLFDVIKGLLVPESRDFDCLWNTLKVAAQFCPLWFMANYFYNSSLSLTSVSSSTILSSTSGLFTLILSICVLGESPDFCKFFAALLSFSGVVIISIEDSNSESESVLGDLLALLSAVFYSLYCIYLSKYSKVVRLSHLFGFVGLLNVIFLWPGFIVLDYTGIEHFELPNLRVLLFLMINGFFGTFLSDLLWAYSIKLLNPVICTLGITLTIPLSMLVDLLANDKSFTFAYFVGCVLIVVGFIIISLFEHPVYKKVLSNNGIKLMLISKKINKTKDDIEFINITNSL